MAHLKEETSRLVEAMKLIRQGLFGEAGGLEREPAIVWGPEVKPDFISWMKQNDKSKKCINTCVSYLDRSVTEPIRTPEDMLKCFERCRSHNLDRALMSLLGLVANIIGKGYYTSLSGEEKKMVKQLSWP